VDKYQYHKTKEKAFRILAPNKKCSQANYQKAIGTMDKKQSFKILWKNTGTIRRRKRHLES
jgi:hypothetical protein